MKKRVLMTLVVFLSGIASVSAASVIDFSVVNISKENQDAEITGAHPGDVLRYELIVESDNESVLDFIPRVDVSDVKQKAKLIDIGLGLDEGNELTYPSFTRDAPYSEEFTFFARVNEKCPPPEQQTIEAEAHGEMTNVAILCGLAPTGADYQNILFVILGAFAIFLVTKWTQKRQA